MTESRAPAYEFPRWKVTLLAVAGVMVILGGVIGAFEGRDPAPAAPLGTVTPTPLGESGFVDGDPLFPEGFDGWCSSPLEGLP